jgi:Cu(I)/Ag(I) efflux system membrane protein CusA/SilA
MIEKIIEICARNRLLVIMITFFVMAAGVYALLHIPLDAIPDLSDVQVIVFTEYPGQSPQVIEDQITYPLTTAMLGVPSAKVVRGYSFFGFSFVYILFQDGTDMYWARTRVLEYLNYVSGRLPAGVTPQLGPDATGVGWVYEYVLESDRLDLAELRTLQDWFLRYELSSVPGVAEVASIGGFVKQYQILVDPDKLVAYGIPLRKIREAVQRSNNDVGGRVVEMAEMEFMVRGLGYIRGIEDLLKVPLGTDRTGTPILLRDVARVKTGPEIRRGLADLDGRGEVVGGIVVMRYGENALEVIRRTKERIEQLKPGLPEGVTIRSVYDRSDLIVRAVNNLKRTLIEESVIVALVCVLFLLHFRSALVGILTLPMGVLISFLIMYEQGINANIMSLGGIAIAIGAMVDAAIVMIENAHRHIEHDRGETPHWQLIINASREVGPALFFSLLIIAVSFLPVFTLQAQEGRLFRPLAFTKTYAMLGASLLAVTIVPILMGYWIRGKIRPEAKNPVNRLLIRLYRPVLRLALRAKPLVLLLALVLLGVTWIPWSRVGSEFMPPLNEGVLLYMPTTLPGISITKARQILEQTDRIIASFPEVEQVFGKVGRADTATDPAPLSMIETTITLKPESRWRNGMTVEKLTREMNDALRFPGLTNVWTMPIKARVDMLTTGIKTPVGIKLMGSDLGVLNDLGKRIEAVIRDVPGTLSVYSERVTGGNYFDYRINREEAARYGLTVGDVEDVIMTGVGGMDLTTTVEGLERFPVNIRYETELRDTPEKLGRILVPTSSGAQIPIIQVADIRIVKGPPAIKSENARKSAWVYVDISGVDVGTYVKRAREAVRREFKLPAGYTMVWSGQYEYMLRAQKRLMLVLPVTLLIIFLLLYLNFKNVAESLFVMLCVPFALTGGMWLMYLLGYDLSVAVGVGFIALAGVSTEIGVVLLIYLDQAFRRHQALHAEGFTRKDLREAIEEGAVLRVRPIMMTFFAILAGLMPIMWSRGTGAEVMRRIAAPMVGGIVSTVVLTLIVVPVIYSLWKGWKLED